MKTIRGSLLLITLVIAACGGGGGSTEPTLPATAQTQRVAAPDEPVPAPQVADAPNISIPPPLNPPTASSGSSGGGTTASSVDEPAPVFTAQLSSVQDTFYADKVLLCFVSGHTTLVVEGSNMVNVELLPAEGYEPVYGEFTVSADGTRATFQLDTINQFTPGVLPVRISAFDAPKGVPAREVHAMTPRSWRLMENCRYASESDWTATYPNGPPLSIPK